MKTPITYALDLGSTYFTLSAPLKEEKSIHLLSCSVESAGFHGGVLSDFSKAHAQLSFLVEKAEHKFNTDISFVCVSISGKKTIARFSEAEETDIQEPVSPSLLASLEKQAGRRLPSDGLETLHAIPLAYLLNGTTWHESPLGLSAKSILARFFFLQAEWAYLYDITRVCNQSGLTVSAFHSIPYASSLPFLSDSTSKMGVGILDLGGESGNGILYARGKPTVLFTLDVGGAFITSDLSIGFSVPLSEAEKMKRLWGSDTENQSEILEVVDLHGKTKVVTKEQALHILHPRLYEMASLIQEKIAPHKHLLGAGIILTGGGSRIKGFDKILHQILQMPCITLTAPGTSQLESKSLDSQDLACSAGMLILESRHKQQSEKNTTTPIGSLLYTEPTLEKPSLFSWFKKTAKS